MEKTIFMVTAVLASVYTGQKKVTILVPKAVIVQNVRV
jgi:hypothetical protein